MMQIIDQKETDHEAVPSKATFEQDSWGLYDFL